MEPEDSKVFIQYGPDGTIVTFHDREILEESSIKALEKTIMPVVEKAKHQEILLDFCNVQFMSSTFLGFLVKIHKHISEGGGHLKLCNINPNIRKVFEITQLIKVFDIS